MWERVLMYLFILFIVLFIAMLWLMLYDTTRFTVQKLTLRDSRIRKPCRAVVLSDLHNKQYGKNNELLLAKIRECEPDFILIAGDMITAKPGKSFEKTLEFLKKLSEICPICYGNGNHEQRLKLYPGTYGDMAEKLAKAFEEIGIAPLVNESTLLEGYGIRVTGLEMDKRFYVRFRIPVMEDSYLRDTLGECKKEFYSVLLAHNPDYFPNYAAWGADLVLSGHVHGGIVRVPFWGKGVLSPNVRLFPRYDGGIFHKGESTMLVDRGLGEHTIPFRLFNPAELWVLCFEPL